MKNYHNLLTAFCWTLALFIALAGCKKGTDEPTPVVPDPPKTATITRVNPPTAPVGGTIAISGTNFGTTPNSQTVTIGGVPATIVSASDTLIVVTVPVGVAAGPISVSVGTQVVQSPTSFSLYVAPPKAIVSVSGTTFANQTWTNDKIYVLKGMVYIPANFALTIQPGTVIKGAGPDDDPERKGQYGTLVIERLGRINAQGTAQQPIIFTSNKPAGQRAPGDWGGLVLVGKSMINQTGTQPLPGGVRGTVETYGEPLDNSGTLRYVRIEYAGARQPGADVALSGLSLYGVGTGTTLDNVQVSYSNNAGFAWYGGTANLRNLVSYYNYDTDLSANWGYAGNVQFAVALRDTTRLGSQGGSTIDLENYAATATTDVLPVSNRNGIPQTAPVFANISGFGFSGAPGTLFGPAVNVRRNAAVSVYNSLFYGYPVGVQLQAFAAPATSADLRGILLANVPTPIVGGGNVTAEQATTAFSTASRANQVITATALPTLLLGNIRQATPTFLAGSGSPLLTGAATGSTAGTFLTSVTYRGAFGTTDWTQGWTNFQPQQAEYDK
jgi:hypothetical protein